jgi:hypothetical protein
VVVRDAVRAAVVTALFWYVLLAVLGIAAVAVGVGLEFGLGYGLLALGVLCLVGSEVVRSGMRRA